MPDGVLYVSNDRSRAIHFNYLVNNRYMMTAAEEPIRLRGLDPDRNYRIRELNLFPGRGPGRGGPWSVIDQERIFTGDYLMKAGYIPETVIDKVNGWLADYRASQQQDAVNVAE